MDAAAARAGLAKEASLSNGGAVFATTPRDATKPTLLVHASTHVAAPDDAAWRDVADAGPFDAGLADGRVRAAGAKDGKGSALTPFFAAEALSKSRGGATMNLVVVCAAQSDDAAAAELLEAKDLAADYAIVAENGAGLGAAAPGGPGRAVFFSSGGASAPYVSRRRGAAASRPPRNVHLVAAASRPRGMSISSPPRRRGSTRPDAAGAPALVFGCRGRLDVAVVSSHAVLVASAVAALHASGDAAKTCGLPRLEPAGLKLDGGGLPAGAVVDRPSGISDFATAVKTTPQKVIEGRSWPPQVDAIAARASYRAAPSPAFSDAAAGAHASAPFCALPCEPAVVVSALRTIGETTRADVSVLLPPGYDDLDAAAAGVATALGLEREGNAEGGPGYLTDGAQPFADAVRARAGARTSRCLQDALRRVDSEVNQRLVTAQVLAAQAAAYETPPARTLAPVRSAVACALARRLPAAAVFQAGRAPTYLATERKSRAMVLVVLSQSNAAKVWASPR